MVSHSKYVKRSDVRICIILFVLVVTEFVCYKKTQVEYKTTAAFCFNGLDKPLNAT